MLSEKTLQHPILILMIFTMLGFIGAFSLGNTSVSMMPDTENPFLSVSASYANAGPESVEKSVTTPIENALVSVSNLENMTSSSYEGGCSVSLSFAYGTDLDEVTNEVREKLDRVTRQLPDGVTPTIRKFSGNNSPIMRIALRGNRTVDDLYAIAQNNIIDILEQAEGVAEASASGGKAAIVRVELEQNRLAAYGLTISGIASQLRSQNIELGGGTITEGKTDYSIRTTGEYQNLQEIKDTVVMTVNGYGVKVSDLGRVYLGHSEATNEVYINGEPGVYISVSKQSGTNSVKVANEVYKKIDQLKQTLPSDVTLSIISDETESIRDTIKTLVVSGLQGLGLAIIILFVFLCSIKSTIIIGISIPLSMIITLLAMNVAGISLNMMTLTGLILGVGMIVDASIVMIDNIYAYRSRGAKPNISAILGSQEMMMSVVSGNLTTICVFVPFIIFINELGFMGQMFKEIIFTIVIALLSSLFVAIFLVPVLAGYFLPLTNRNEKPLKSNFFIVLYGAFNKAQDGIRFVYGKVLKTALKYRFASVFICVTLLAVSVLIYTTLGQAMITGGRDDSVTLRITLPVGTTFEETASIVYQFQDIIEEEIEGYSTLITTVGGGRGSSNSGNIQIQLPVASEQIDSAQTIQSKLRKHFAGYTDVTFSFGRGMRQQLSGDDFVLVVSSDTLDSSMATAKVLCEILENMNEVGEPSMDVTEGLPQVEIEIDRQRAYDFGVNVNTVASEIRASIQGTSATTYRKDGQDYAVYVMLRPEDRQNILDLDQIFVRGTNGMVSVANFAKVTKGYGPVSIYHDNRKRIVEVKAGNLTDLNNNIVEDRIKEAIASNYIIPDGVSVTYEGSWKSMQEQNRIIYKIILLAVILVFAVMAATYESFKAPIINITTIPFLIIGVVFIYKITGQAISLMSYVGVIMLVGIVVNNGIILVDYTNLLVERGVSLLDACYQAGCSRLRPVLMTTLTTILGMIPMCFASSGSASMVQPIGVAVVGGLTSSTFITLFFIPVLYSLIMRNKGKRKHSRIEIKVEE